MLLIPLTRNDPPDNPRIFINRHHIVCIEPMRSGGSYVGMTNRRSAMVTDAPEVIAGLVNDQAFDGPQDDDEEDILF